MESVRLNSKKKTSREIEALSRPPGDPHCNIEGIDGKVWQVHGQSKAELSSTVRHVGE